MSDAVRILVADDHLVVRLGLVAILDRQDDMSVVAQAATGSEAVELYGRHRPDVILMDLRMPGGSGVEAITAIRTQDPQARIIVITVNTGDEEVLRALRAGALGYLLKDAPGSEIVAAIRRVMAGQPNIPLGLLLAAAEPAEASPLSPREVEVVALIARGFSNKRIADALGVSNSTVKNHITSLMQKLGADDRAHAVTLALTRGLIDLERLPPG
jgi:two-component system, NarL family, response regulator